MMKLILALSILFTLPSFAQSGDINPAEAKLLEEEALKLWKKRDHQESLEEALSKFEHVHRVDATDLETLAYLSRGYYLLGDAHYKSDDQKKKAFEKGREYGIEGMRTNSKFQKRMDKDDLEEAVGELTEKEVPLIFWTAANTGKWAKINGIFSSLKYKDGILAMIKQVEKLKPDYFYGAVPRYWGGFYALAPSIAGGDMKKSKKNFQKSMEMAPEYLGTRTLYAEVYLAEVDADKEYKKQLEIVLSASDGPEEIAPENRLEKQKAKKLLKK